MYQRHWRIQDFPEERGGANYQSLLRIYNFAENCMKMKEFGPRGRPWPPLRSATERCCSGLWEVWSPWNRLTVIQQLLVQNWFLYKIQAVWFYWFHKSLRTEIVDVLILNFYKAIVSIPTSAPSTSVQNLELNIFMGYFTWQSYKLSHILRCYGKRIYFCHCEAAVVGNSISH